MKKIAIALILCLMMVSVASANNVRKDCGCGLGGMAIGDKEGLLWNLLGTFLNGMCGNQTFAMSTGTSDCGQPEKLAILDQMNIFVADNMDALAVDIAQGNGDSLDALAEIAKISEPNRPVFYSALQNNFNRIYPNTDVTSDTVVTEISKIIETI
jgi:hypothetical protein